MSESVRPLFEDATASSELRNFVALARADGPSQAELDGMARRMAPVLGVSAAVLATTTAAAVGTAPASAVGAFGAPSSGLTTALGGGAAAAAKSGAAAAKVGLLGQLLASTGAKVVAVSLSLGAASVGAYGLTRSERPPAGPHAPVAGQAATARARRPAPESAARSALQAAPVAAAEVESQALANPPSATEHPERDQRAAGRAERPRVVARSSARRGALATKPAPAAPSAVATIEPEQQAGVAEPAAAAVAVIEPAKVEPAKVEPAKVEPAKVEPAPPPSVPPPSELSLIQGAQAARGRPSEALAFLAKHEQVYPRGALAQEREVLAIEILLKAHKRTQAEARADRFADTYPGSAHLPRVRALLAREAAR